jgi:hypothetical protein
MTRFLLLLVLSSCAGVKAVRAPTAESVAGCYVLNLGEWSLRPEPARVLPDTIRLNTEVIPDQHWLGLPLRTFEPPLPAFDQTDEPGNWNWYFNPPDSLRLRWTGSFSMVRMDVQARGDELVGEVIMLTDVLGVPRDSLPVASVRARRITCPS